MNQLMMNKTIFRNLGILTDIGTKFKDIRNHRARKIRLKSDGIEHTPQMNVRQLVLILFQVTKF